MPNKQTPIQKVIQWVNDNYPNFNHADIEAFLQSLLSEERQMVEDAYMSGQRNFDLNEGLFPSQYFNNKYQS